MTRARTCSRRRRAGNSTGQRSSGCSNRSPKPLDCHRESGTRIWSSTASQATWLRQELIWHLFANRWVTCPHRPPHAIATLLMSKRLSNPAKLSQPRSKPPLLGCAAVRRVLLGYAAVRRVHERIAVVLSGGWLLWMDNLSSSP